MEEVALLPNELMATPIKMSIKEGVSIINENPISFLEKYGKYEFIYDYQVPNFSWQNLLQPLQSSLNSAPPSMYKESGSNANMIAPNMIWSGQSFPKPVNVYSEPQVGTFSKGNIVNVLRFDGNNAIIQNPNYIEPDSNAPKVGFFSGLDLKNQKEFTIPKSYLRKVDDNLSVTVSTGILYGANMEQPVYNVPPVKPIYDTTLEQNATFVLTKDFDYVSGYVPSVCPPNELCKQSMVAQYSVLKSGTKVSGRLFSKYIKGFSGGIASAYRPDTQQNVLKVEGYGSQGSIEIPIEYLTRPIISVVSLVDKKTGKCNQTGELQTEEYNPCRVSAVKGETYKGYIAGGSFYTNDGKTFLPNGEYIIIEENNGTVVPVANNNKNMLMIIGAFLVGYVLFSKNNSTN